jgi:hypothetical protein
VEANLVGRPSGRRGNVPAAHFAVCGCDESGSEQLVSSAPIGSKASYVLVLFGILDIDFRAHPFLAVLRVTSYRLH